MTDSDDKITRRDVGELLATIGFSLLVMGLGGWFWEDINYWYHQFSDWLQQFLVWLETAEWWFWSIVGGVIIIIITAVISREDED